MSARRPTPAKGCDPIPHVDELFGPPPPPAAPSREAHAPLAVAALASLAAAGAVQGEAPRCGETRAEEFAQHAPEVIRLLRGDPVGALREVGVAAGLVSHIARIEPGRSGAAMTVGLEAPEPVLAPLPIDLPPTRPPSSPGAPHGSVTRGAVRRVEPRQMIRPGGRAMVNPGRGSNSF